MTIKNGTIVTDGVTDAIVINAGTLTFGENLTVKSTRGAIIDAEGGKFVLAGAKLEGGNTYTTVYIGSNAEMNMTEGEITGPDKGALSVYGRATVTGGTISASNGSTIKAGSGGTVNLNGGKISNGNSSLCAVFAVSGGKVVVDGAEIDGAGGALIAAGGTVEVKSGTIKDSSLALVAHSGGTATISGGTFTGSRYAVSDNADGRQCYGPSSGSFYTSGTVTITGGTFSMDPSAYLASNYEIAKTVDDMYKVIASGTATAKIGEIKYVTLADAVTAANVNDAITMLTDETTSSSPTVITSG